MEQRTPEAMLWAVARANRQIVSDDGELAAVFLPVNLLEDIEDAIGYDEQGQ